MPVQEKADYSICDSGLIDPVSKTDLIGELLKNARTIAVVGTERQPDAHQQ